MMNASGQAEVCFHLDFLHHAAVSSAFRGKVAVKLLWPQGSQPHVTTPPVEVNTRSGADFVVTAHPHGEGGRSKSKPIKRLSL